LLVKEACLHDKQAPLLVKEACLHDKQEALYRSFWPQKVGHRKALAL